MCNLSLVDFAQKTASEAPAPGGGSVSAYLGSLGFVYFGRLLARLEGLLSGISSGAALAATIKIGERKELMNKRLIVILPSFGERYLSTAMFESNTSIQARKDGYL